MISVSRFIIAPHSPPPSLNTCGKGLGEEEEEDPFFRFSPSSPKSCSHPREGRTWRRGRREATHLVGGERLTLTLKKERTLSYTKWFSDPAR